MLSGGVLKALEKSKVRDFIIKQNINIKAKTEEYELNSNGDNFILQLLNQLIYHKELDNRRVDEFLIDQLSYGKLTNTYIRVIDTHLITDDQNAIQRINKLERYEYRNASQVSNLYFCKDIRSNVEVGQKKLILSEIITDGKKVANIKLILAEGIYLGDGNEDRGNNYYSIEIDLKNKVFICKIRNWAGQAKNKYSPDKVNSEIEGIILRCFGLVFNTDSQKFYNSVYSIVYELADIALKDTCNIVNDKIKDKVSKSVNEWWKDVLDGSLILKQADRKIIIESILNNYYKYYIKKKYGKITKKKMIELFDLYAYPRRVKFIDDTVGEGNAMSSDPEESLFDTAVFYDLKARYDHSKIVQVTQIYWLKCPSEKCFGTTIYTNKQNLFKIIFLPHSYNKEMFEYVLHQIKRNFK